MFVKLKFSSCVGKLKMPQGLEKCKYHRSLSKFTPKIGNLLHYITCDHSTYFWRICKRKYPYCLMRSLVISEFQRIRTFSFEVLPARKVSMNSFTDDLPVQVTNGYVVTFWQACCLSFVISSTPKIFLLVDC